MTARAESLDRTFAAISIALFLGLAVATIAAMVYTGLPGLGVMFIVWLVAVPVWARVTREWMQERERLAERSRIDTEEKLLDEIRQLRESIEALRRSLEG